MSAQPTTPEPIRFAVPHITEDDIDAVAAVLRSGWLSTGAACSGLEADLCELTGAPHVIAVSSCTAALEISLRSLRLPRGARVGVPTWTFVASASAIVETGGEPVLLDVDPDTLNVSVEAVSAAIDAGLDALMVVHFGGVPVAREVLELAAEAGIPVIEDAAHALGASDHRGSISGGGTVSACYSFYATKNLTSAEGGAIATHDDELAAYARSQRLHGLSNDAWGRYRVGASPHYDLLEPGLKANLPDVLAALARSQLARFPAMQAQRRAIVETYRRALDGPTGLRVVPSESHPGSADHLFVVLLPEGVDREQLMGAMSAAGVGTSIHFRPVHSFTWYRQHATLGPTGVTTADRLARRALSLPLSAAHSIEDAERVVDALLSALP